MGYFPPKDGSGPGVSLFAAPCEVGIDLRETVSGPEFRGRGRRLAGRGVAEINACFAIGQVAETEFSEVAGDGGYACDKICFCHEC